MSRYNVCGVLVHARGEKAGNVAELLREMPGTEVHTVTDDGRLVVTVEDTDEQLAIDTIGKLADVAGVISTSLVYHEFDDDDNDDETTVAVTAC